MTLRVAAVQIGPVPRDWDASVTKAEQWIDRAAEEGVQLAVFPEGYLCGFEQIQEARAEAAGDLDRFAELLVSEPIPGPATDRIGARARAHGMHIVFGMMAQNDDGRLINASILFDPSGAIAHVHNKIHLTPSYEAPETEPGTGFTVTETEIGPIGQLICADLSIPESTRILAIKGARVVCGSLAGFSSPGVEGGGPVKHLFLNSHCSPSRAIDNGVFMVLCNMVGVDGGLEYFGRSRIIDPAGYILAEGGEGHLCEELVLADLDVDATGSGSLPFRLIDRRRPDLYEEILTPNPNLADLVWSES